MISASHSRQVGSSFVEFLIASSLSLIAISTIGSVYLTGARYANQRSQELVVLHSMRNTLSYITADAQRAGFSPLPANSVTIISGASKVWHTTPSSLAYGYFDGNTIESVFFKFADQSIKVCTTNSMAVASLNSCHRFYNFMDQNTIKVTNFSISQKGLGSQVSSAFLSISLSASMHDGSFPHTMTTSIKQRNWQ